MTSVSNDDYRAQVEAAVRLFDDDHFTEAALALRSVPPVFKGDHADKCEQIRECDHELVNLLEDMLDNSKWNLKYESRGVRVSLENSRDKLIRVKCEGEASVDVFSVCACLLEVDLFPEWMPGVDEALVTRKLSKFRKVVRISGPKPWPIKRDEAHVVAYGDVVDCGRLGAATNSSTTKRAGVGVYLKPVPNPSVTKGRHLIEISGGWFIEPLPTRGDQHKRSRLTLIARIDPKIRLLPNWVINFVVKNIAYLFIPMIARQAKAFEKPLGRHTDRIDVQPDVYQEIEARLELLSASLERQVATEVGDKGDKPPLPREEPVAVENEAEDERNFAASPPLPISPTVPQEQRDEQTSLPKLSTKRNRVPILTALLVIFFAAVFGRFAKVVITPTPPPPPPLVQEEKKRRLFGIWPRRPQEKKAM